MDFYSDQGGIDLREELSALLRGRVDVVPQGREVILRRITDDRCPACWDKVSGGTTRQMCKYCQGEGFLWRETRELVYMVRGVAPIYKPGNLGTGKYPQAGYGYVDPNRGTCYIEAVTPEGRSLFPDYERYTLPSHDSYDTLFELKADDEGGTAQPLIRVAKWKVLTLVPYHGDFGRVEFFELGLEKQNV